MIYVMTLIFEEKHLRLDIIIQQTLILFLEELSNVNTIIRDCLISFIIFQNVE